MEYRTLGRTGLKVAALGFGCGNVGGLMVRGTPAERERAVARAIELGINYFDTAPAYGDGLSEQHLGQALKALKARVYVGTKVRLAPGDLNHMAPAIGRSLEASLGRLGSDRVDLLQLHNAIAPERRGNTLGVADVLEQAVPALDKLRREGKIGFWGITALGDTEALHRVVDSGAMDSAQVFFNLLDPSAGIEVPPGFPGQDFHGLLARARVQRVGVIVVRVLAGGALSGTPARHPVAAPAVEPIATGPDYGTDVARAQGLTRLVDEGHVESLVEAALRFPLGMDAVSTVLLGYSTQAHLEYAAASMAKGPLPPAALDRLVEFWSELAGTPRDNRT
ncbi:MAG TPA: aldo/keto reductase [Methylomirabilota bacterium]|nr:aldo/keto reductase [Methylomirabilota bacterium]